jgi:hypothetical protein
MREKVGNQSKYLIRNPFDTMVSYYNYMSGFGYNKGFDEFVKDENYGIKAWKRHVNSWFGGKNDPQKIHLIKYEDLMNNPTVQIKSLYANFGLLLEESLISTAIERSSMENMKNGEINYTKFNPNRTLNFVGALGKKTKKELLTDKIKEYIYAEVGEELQKFYPDMCKPT